MRSVDRVQRCLLLGVDRIYRGHHETDASDPKPTSAEVGNLRSLIAKARVLTRITPVTQPPRRHAPPRSIPWLPSLRKGKERVQSTSGPPAYCRRGGSGRRPI